MSLSTIATINNYSASAPIILGPQYTYETFNFSATLGVGVMTISSPSDHYTGGSGLTAYRNGYYLMMSKYNNSTNIAWCMFSQDTKFWMTGLITSNTWTYFDTTTQSVATGQT
jgi:hypothetical protein